MMEGESVVGSGGTPMVNHNNPEILKMAKVFGLDPAEYAKEVSAELKSLNNR